MANAQSSPKKRQKLATFTEIQDDIEKYRSEMIELQTLLTSIPAISPESGGQGEFDKAEALVNWLKSKGFAEFSEIQVLNAPDSRAKNSVRPNIIVTIPGKNNESALWIMTHLDIVPPGDLKSWHSDPYTVVEKDGCLIGRGVEDNQQGMVSSIFAALALLKNNEKPLYTVKLVFMADEECGSAYGMNWLLTKHKEMFGKQDLYLIPDGGDSNGETIEVAEKSILWIRFHTIGLQSHGSMPDKGRNAALAGCDLMLRIADLENLYNKTDSIFEPPYSTFQPTMRLANVSSINIIPGEDISCCDCRILPCYNIEGVLEEIKNRCNAVEKKYGVKIELEICQKEQSPATPASAPVVQKLADTLKQVHGINARTIGIGGGTVGALLRSAGYNAAIWSSLNEVCHQPNEYCVIDNMVKDAKTMAALMLS